MIAAFLGPTDHQAQGALQAVDKRREALGIYESKLGLALEFANGAFKFLGFDRHANLVRTLIRDVHIFPVNLYSSEHVFHVTSPATTPLSPPVRPRVPAPPCAPS